jgi:hypothetical protein
MNQCLTLQLKVSILIYTIILFAPERMHRSASMTAERKRALWALVDSWLVSLGRNFDPQGHRWIP